MSLDKVHSSYRAKQREGGNSRPRLENGRLAKDCNHRITNITTPLARRTAFASSRSTFMPLGQIDLKNGPFGFSAGHKSNTVEEEDGAVKLLSDVRTWN